MKKFVAMIMVLCVVMTAVAVAETSNRANNELDTFMEFVLHHVEWSWDECYVDLHYTFYTDYTCDLMIAYEYYNGDKTVEMYENWMVDLQFVDYNDVELTKTLLMDELNTEVTEYDLNTDWWVEWL